MGFDYTFTHYMIIIMVIFLQYLMGREMDGSTLGLVLAGACVSELCLFPPNPNQPL